MNKENIIKYGIPILSVILVALLGSIFTNMGLDWYETLARPSEWIFSSIIPIMWSIIYTLFTIYLLYLVHKDKLKKKQFILLVINGFLNVLWCLTYFTLESLLGGQIVIVINLIFSILLIKEVYKTNKVWGYILGIYSIWLSIATCLNLAIWILN